MQKISRPSLPDRRPQPLVNHVGFFGALIALLATIPGVWNGTLWDNSETAYSEVAREIFTSGDAIVMHLNGQPWFIQPPLFFWCAALCTKLFGITSFAMRLPAVISTIVMGTLLAVFSARLIGARAARYATLILSTMLMQVVIGRLAIMDAMLDMSIMITILSWCQACLTEIDEGARGRALIIGSISAAIGILTKGPVALVLPLLIVGCWIWSEGRVGRGSRPPWSAGFISIAAMLAILGPWLYLYSMRTGTQGLEELIFHYTVGRYLGVIENQTGPWYYYLPVMILAIFPWTGIFSAAVVQGFQKPVTLLRGKTLPDAMLRLGMLWSFLPAFFFSFAQTKLPNYIALSLPGMALLCGIWLDEHAVLRSRKLLVPFLLVPVFSALIIVAMLIFAKTNTLSSELQQLAAYAVAFVACILLGAIVALICLAKRRTTGYAPYALATGTLAAMTILGCFALPKAEQFKPIPPLAAIITQQRQPQDIVAIQGVHGNNSLMFYSAPPVTILDSPDTKPKTIASDPQYILKLAPRIFLIAPTKRPTPDPTYGRRRRVIAVSGKDTLFLIDTAPPNL